MQGNQSDSSDPSGAKSREVPTEVWIASDHAGLERKREILRDFPKVSWQDLGTNSTESVDYPDFADQLCQKVLKSGRPGILICGSGQGMAMRANRHPGIRAALCWSGEVAGLSRAHNNANVLCLGGRITSLKDCSEAVKNFLATEFEGGRHGVRVDKIERPC